MFFHLLYIHLFRPFLKYNPSTSPLPSHVSPRKVCIQAASAISKLMRLYKRTYGLRQICNLAVYIVHSACTIHLLNLPEKDSKRDIVHGVKNLEEIAEDWLCARRTLSILSVLARKWQSELPEEAQAVLARTDAKYGFFSTSDVPSPKPDSLAHSPPPVASSPLSLQQTSMSPDTERRQNPLMESLYSYALPVSSNPPPNGDRNVAPTVPSQMHVQLRMGGPSSAPNTSRPMSMPGPYSTSTPTSHSDSQHTPAPLTTSDDPASISAPMNNRASPSMLFGGVEMLVESQDSWLRDQANLPVGFDNWMGMTTAGQSGEFFIGDSGRRRSEMGYGLDDEWTTYN